MKKKLSNQYEDLEMTTQNASRQKCLPHWVTIKKCHVNF